MDYLPMISFEKIYYFFFKYKKISDYEEYYKSDIVQKIFNAFRIQLKIDNDTLELINKKKESQEQEQKQEQKELEISACALYVPRIHTSLDRHTRISHKFAEE